MTAIYSRSSFSFPSRINHWQPFAYKNLEGKVLNEIFVPTDLGIERQRYLSLDLGNGDCKWQPPKYDVPNQNFIDFHKTVVAGFPSGDKRMIYIQMEALTGWREYLLNQSASSVI